MSADARNKVVVVGASGMVGSAALAHFAARPEWEVVGVSRRFPPNLAPELAARVTHLPVDLTDAEACAQAFGALTDVTHVVYAAVHEQVGDVVEGWQAGDQMQTNRAMLVNFFEPLEAAAPGLRHVSVLQGTKAYGNHVLWPAKGMSAPARESEPRHPHENFYWLQEDYIREKQVGKQWSWTLWRPQLVFGDPVGSNLSVISVIGAYAALEKAAGRGLSYPGGPSYVVESIDVDVLADAIGWATTSDASHNETFNVANGDIMIWENVWPAIAEACGMEVAPPEPRSLLATLPGRQEEWAALVDRHGLASPRSLEAFIGGSAGVADLTFAYHAESPPPPVVLSTIKLRQAGFHGCMDSEEMLRKWIARLQELRYIPV